MEFQDRVNDIAAWPSLGERLEKAVEIVRRGREPYFFFSDNGTKDISPVYEGGEKRIENMRDSLLDYLIPQHVGKIGNILEDYKNGEEYASDLGHALATIRAIAHFHPDNCIEPSIDDLGFINSVYGTWNSDGYERPLHIIGRCGSAVELLIIDQVARFDYRKASKIADNIEKNLVLEAFPNHLKGTASESEIRRLRVFLDSISQLDHPSFFAELRKYREKMKCQNGVESFRRIFLTDFTILPEYVDSVLKTLKETGMYDVNVIEWK